MGKVAPERPTPAEHPTCPQPKRPKRDPLLSNAETGTGFAVPNAIVQMSLAVRLELWHQRATTARLELWNWAWQNKPAKVSD